MSLCLLPPINLCIQSVSVTFGMAPKSSSWALITPGATHQTCLMSATLETSKTWYLEPSSMCHPVRDDDLIRKPETRRVFDPTGAGVGEDFDLWVQLVSDPKFRGYGCGFLFYQRAIHIRLEIWFSLYFCPK